MVDIEYGNIVQSMIRHGIAYKRTSIRPIDYGFIVNIYGFDMEPNYAVSSFESIVFGFSSPVSYTLFYWMSWRDGFCEDKFRWITINMTLILTCWHR